MLAGTVDAGKRLFMQQADQIIFLGGPLQDIHDHMVLVNCHGGRAVYAGQFKLGRGGFVVFRLGVDAQFPELFVDVLHKGRHPGRDGSLVMIFQFLSLRCAGPEQGPAGEAQVVPEIKVFAVNQEVFLFQSADRIYIFDILVAKQVDHFGCGFVEGPDGFQDRGLLVNGITAVGYEYGRNVQDIVHDEYRAGNIPVRVAAGFIGGAQAAAWETRCIRFAHDQILSGEMGKRLAVLVRFHKTFVFFRGGAVHWLEPVCVMCTAAFHGPALHGMGDRVSCRPVQCPFIRNSLLPLLIDRTWQTFLHGLIIKYHAPESLKWSFHRSISSL